MLRIPSEGQETAPLMASLQKIDFSEDAIDPRGEKRTRSTRKKKEQEVEQPAWDASKGKWRSNSKSSLRVWKVIGAWIGSMALITAIVLFFVKSSEPTKPGAGSDFEDPKDQFDDLVKGSTPLLLPDKEIAEDEVELPKVMKRSEPEFLAKTKPLAEKFLNATTIAEMLPFVYDPKVIEKKMLSHYPTGKITPTGMSKFNSSGRVSYKDSFAAVTIQTPEFETKQLAFIDAGDGLKIDWESWVGWSEMPWIDFLKIKPTEPKLVRVMLKWVDYYNFDFFDEKKWRAYRLTSPDGETMLYGYAARNSLLDQRLRPGEPGTTVAVMLKIHFPENAQKDNQVIIDEYVSDGWVVGVKKK